MTPCLDCGAPLGPVTEDLSIYWCETCRHRYRNGAGKLLTEKMEARIKRYEDERNAREAK